MFYFCRIILSYILYFWLETSKKYKTLNFWNRSLAFAAVFRVAHVVALILFVGNYDGNNERRCMFENVGLTAHLFSSCAADKLVYGVGHGLKGIDFPVWGLLCVSLAGFFDMKNGLPMLGEDGFGRAVVDVESLGGLNKQMDTCLIDMFFSIMYSRKRVLMESLTLQYFFFLWRLAVG